MQADRSKLHRRSPCEIQERRGNNLLTYVTGCLFCNMPDFCCLTALWIVLLIFQPSKAFVSGPEHIVTREQIRLANKKLPSTGPQQVFIQPAAAPILTGSSLQQ